jgi:hypothetical protein
MGCRHGRNAGARAVALAPCRSRRVAALVDVVSANRRAPRRAAPGFGPTRSPDGADLPGVWLGRRCEQPLGAAHIRARISAFLASNSADVRIPASRSSPSFLSWSIGSAGGAGSRDGAAIDPPAWWAAISWRIISAPARAGSKSARVRAIVCHRCDRRMFGEAHDGVPYMACMTQRERHACDQRGVRSSVLEDQVGAWLATLRIPDDWQADIARLQAGIARAVDEGPRVDREKIAAQLGRLGDLYVDGAISREEYVGRRRALDASLAGGAPQHLLGGDPRRRGTRPAGSRRALAQGDVDGAPRAMSDALRVGACPGPGDRRGRARATRVPAAHRIGRVAITCRRWCGAPGRIRTADAGLRTAALYPLSYGGAAHIVARRT